MGVLRDPVHLIQTPSNCLWRKAHYLEGRCRFKMRRGMRTPWTYHLPKFHSEWLVKVRPALDVFLVTNTPLPWESHCWIHWQHYPLLILSINASICKFLTDFLLFPKVHFIIWMLNSRTLYIQKMLLGNIWSIPTTLKKWSKIMQWKNTQGLYKATHVGLLPLRAKPSYSRDYVCQRGKPRFCWQPKPWSSKTQDVIRNNSKFTKAFWDCQHVKPIWKF